MYNGNAPGKGQQGWPKRHGLTKTKVHMAWRQMKKRCLNPKCAMYKHYGGRGITICERWLSFDNFFADMGHPPEGMSLERVDNEGNYCPENCKWATRIEQLNNTRKTRKVSINGISKSLTEWARESHTTSHYIKQLALKMDWIK